jgi:hypothetical protein
VKVYEGLVSSLESRIALERDTNSNSIEGLRKPGNSAYALIHRHRGTRMSKIGSLFEAIAEDLYVSLSGMKFFDRVTPDPFTSGVCDTSVSQNKYIKPAVVEEYTYLVY